MVDKELDLRSTITNPVHVEGDIWLVACKTNPQSNSFTPLLKPLDLSLKSSEYSKVKTWSENEDNTLKSIILSKGAKNWSNIANELNCLFHNRMLIRQGRQCRERWFNHLNPELNKGKWTHEEDRMLKSLQKNLGNKWSEISKLIKGRNENSVKNRFKSFDKGKGQAECGEEGEIDDLLYESQSYSCDLELAVNRNREECVKMSRRKLGEFVKDENKLDYEFLEDLEE